MLEEELFSIQNKILVSKTSILQHIFVPYTTQNEQVQSHFYGFS